MKLIIKNHKTGKIYKVEINEKNLDWLESNYNFVSFLNEHPSQDLAAAVQDFADYLSNHHIEAYIENDIQKSEDKKPLNKPIRTPGENKKFKVYVKDGDKTKTVRFGDPNMEIKRDSKERRSNFRARHNCESPGPKTKARYWSCKMWSKRSVSDLTKSTLEKMSRPRITLPHFKDLPTRPDQNIQGIATPNQKKIFARKIAQAIYPDAQTKKTNVSYSPETKEFNVSEPQQVKVSRQSDRDRQASAVMRDTGKKHFGAVYHGKNYTIGGTTEGAMYSPDLDRNDEYVEAVKQHTQKRNQMVRDYNDQYRAWQSKGWDLSRQHSAENDEAKKFALQTELEEHIKNKPQKPKLPRKPALKSKPVDEKKISLEDYKKRGKGILAVREHEGLHYLLNQVSKKYGGQAYRQTMDHLLSHHDQSALNYIKGFITQVYKYKPGSSGFGEELLAHSRDILVNPKKRGYFVDYLKTKGETKPELVVQALKRGHQNVYNAAQNLKPEHVGIDTGKLAASEDMKKGAARRLYGKFDPVKELDGDNSMSNWVTGNSGIDSDGEIRSKIPNPSSSAKLRATNKLANKTTSRLNPATKQREFLLHRQMSQWEYDKNVKNGRVKHSSNAHTSWTPSLAAITEKSGIYSRDSFDEKDNQSYNTVISAWVPESHIKTIPSQYGRSGTDSPSKRGAPSYLEEHEVIVSPGHNSEVYQILQDTGENKKEWTWRKIK